LAIALGRISVRNRSNWLRSRKNRVSLCARLSAIAFHSAPSGLIRAAPMSSGTPEYPSRRAKGCSRTSMAPAMSRVSTAPERVFTSRAISATSASFSIR